jgi:flagellar biosynthesis protein
MTQNPQQQPIVAVALSYNKMVDIAPQIVAKGKDYMAKQLIELAKKHNIAICQDENLATTLAQLELGSLIPIEAYMVVGEILSYIYSVNQRKV